MEEILTAEQVAQILQVHPFTVLKFIKQGKLKASKLGRVYRIRKSDVDGFLDNQVEQASIKTTSKNSKPRKEKVPAEKQKGNVEKPVEKPTEIITETPKESLNQNSERKLAPEKKEIDEKTTHLEIEAKKEPDKNKRINMNDVDHYVLELKKTEI